jgi:hypothetical protein
MCLRFADLYPALAAKETKFDAPQGRQSIGHLQQKWLQGGGSPRKYVKNFEKYQDSFRESRSLLRIERYLTAQKHCYIIRSYKGKGVLEGFPGRFLFL